MGRAVTYSEKQYKKIKDTLEKKEKEIAEYRNALPSFYKSSKVKPRFVVSNDDVEKNGVEYYKEGVMNLGASFFWYEKEVDAWFSDK